MSAKTNGSSYSRKFRKYLVQAAMPFLVGGILIASAWDSVPVQGALLTLRSLVVMPLLSTFVCERLTPRFFRTAAWCVGFLVIINLPLAIVQFFSPQDAFINSYVGGTNDGVATSGVSNRVRATGTFSYISGLTFASIAGTGAGLFLVVMEQNFVRRAAGAAIVASAFGLALATVSRGPIFAIAGIGAVILAQRPGLRVVALIGALGLFLLLPSSDATITGNSSSSSSNRFEEFTTTLFQRAVSADSVVDRLSMPFVDFVYQLRDSPFGNGLGSGQSVMRRFGSEQVVESELGRIVYEIGLIGFVGYIVVYLGAVIFLLRIARLSQSVIDRFILRTAAAFCFLLFFGGVAFNHVSSTIFWGIFVCCLVWISRESLPTSRAFPKSGVFRLRNPKLPAAQVGLPK